ncbi:hypothetical protein CN195_16020, partial [Sinorhizobium meliloti]
ARSLPRAGGECGVQLAPLVPSPRLRGEGAGRRMRGGIPDRRLRSEQPVEPAMRVRRAAVLDVEQG